MLKHDVSKPEALASALDNFINSGTNPQSKTKSPQSKEFKIVELIDEIESKHFQIMKAFK